MFLQTIHQTWEKPSSAPASSKRLDHMYRVQEQSAAFLFSHPKPNSLVVSSSVQSKHRSSPPDADGKTIDSYGRRLYTTGALGIKACNYMACMARFLYAVLEDFSAFIPHLPESLRPKALHLQTDGLAAACQQVNTSKHIVESSAKTLVSAVALRRFALLRSTALPAETKTMILDLPFDGMGLFNSGTDTQLQRIDKSIKASRALGVSSSSSRPSSRQQQPYCQWWARQGCSLTWSSRQRTSSSS